MKLKIRSQPDFLSGLLFMGLGIGFSWFASHYQLGTAAEMGPGFFPLVLGGLLAILGLVVALLSVTRLDEEEKIEPVSVRPIILVLGSVALFGALLLPLGLVAASFVLVLTSALASHEFDWRYAILTAVVLIGACCLIFVYGLELPMPLWPGAQ